MHQPSLPSASIGLLQGLGWPRAARCAGRALAVALPPPPRLQCRLGAHCLPCPPRPCGPGWATLSTSPVAPTCRSWVRNVWGIRAKCPSLLLPQPGHGHQGMHSPMLLMASVPALSNMAGRTFAPCHTHLLGGAQRLVGRAAAGHLCFCIRVPKARLQGQGSGWQACSMLGSCRSLLTNSDWSVCAKAREQGPTDLVHGPQLR